jgi:CelD/BcsL family acetyltransferase involved in cellulose biosynthesis
VKAERIRRSHRYDLWREGNGPRFYRAGSRRRLTEEACRDWHFLGFLDSGSALVFIRTHPQRQPRELRLFLDVKP